ncbi:hypothetical protein [Qipengyuania spongiae]|uniref:Uncharacterized protein n=1 Tax=Qipengyuania spongiae TaxID=2909673 RepID=A0ABY5SYA6_9SPHN|nr:hypothetical protein [Qipengyuania spongiae]UVI39224.1 hypothetical protein L1F33_13490 [Qipengyuania spongiae]
MFEPTIIIATAALIGLAVVTAGLLVGWREWLALKRQELDRQISRNGATREEGSSLGAARIEISDLKERIRKLEAIASGVDP